MAKPPVIADARGPRARCRPSSVPGSARQPRQNIFSRYAHLRTVPSCIATSVRCSRLAPDEPHQNSSWRQRVDREPAAHLARIVADYVLHIRQKQTKRSTRNNRKSNLKRIEGRIKVEASVPIRFCVALETVRMAKFLKSVCLVVQIKGGATLFTTRPCRVLCDKQVASGPRKKPLVASDAGTWSTGWTSRDARTPTSSQPGLYDRNRGAEAPERPRARGTSQPGSLRALARSCAWCAKRWQRACHRRPSKVKATEGPLPVAAFRVLPRPRARAWPPAEDGARSGSEAHRVPATDARVPCLAGADPAANHDCLPTSVPGRFASLERMQCGCVAAQRLPFIHSRRGHVPPTRGHQQHDPRGFRRR